MRGPCAANERLLNGPVWAILGAVRGFWTHPQGARRIGQAKFPVRETPERTRELAKKKKQEEKRLKKQAAKEAGAEPQAGAEESPAPGETKPAA
jgi:hypothetical protein